MINELVVTPLIDSKNISEKQAFTDHNRGRQTISDIGVTNRTIVEKTTVRIQVAHQR